MNPLSEALLVSIAQSSLGFESIEQIDFSELNQVVIESPLLGQDLVSMPGAYYRIDFDTPTNATRFRAELGSQGFTNCHVTTNGVAFAVVVINDDFENPYQ